MRLSVAEVFANLVRQLMSVLARRRNFDRSLPVVVEMAKFEGQTLMDGEFITALVVDDVEVSGRDCALIRRLRDQEEVLVLQSSHRRVDYGPRVRVLELIPAFQHEPLRNSFGDDGVSDLGRVSFMHFLRSSHARSNFLIVNDLYKPKTGTKVVIIFCNESSKFR